MKSLRKISPFISLLLMTLILSGSLGYTLIKHTCQHCDTEEIFTLVAGNDDDEICCCTHEAGVSHHHIDGEMIISDDCCTHEAERIVTDELVRTEAQNQIIPYFHAAAIVGIIPEIPERSIRTFILDKPFRCERDLTTMHCQIKS